MLLRVGWGHRAFAFRSIGHAPDVEELLGHVQIQAISSHPVQLAQCQFQFLMPRRLHDRAAVVVVRVAFEEDLVEMPGALLGNLQPFVFARGLVVGDGALVHVAQVVEFMAVDDPGVRPLAHLLRPSDSADMRYIQVAIVLLGLGDHVDDFVQLLFEGGIGFDHQQIGGSFHHLVQSPKKQSDGETAIHRLAHAGSCRNGGDFPPPARSASARVELSIRPGV